MTKHKFIITHEFPVTGNKREQCEVCGALRWTQDGQVTVWQPETYAKYYRDCDAPPEEKQVDE